MKAKELIAALQKMPPDADVTHLWDGGERTNIELVYLSRGGTVVTSDFGMSCYATDSRPADAPTVNEERWWKTANGKDEGSG